MNVKYIEKIVIEIEGEEDVAEWRDFVKDLEHYLKIHHLQAKEQGKANDPALHLLERLQGYDLAGWES